MKNKLTNVLFLAGKSLITTVMKAIIFLFCTTMFSITPSSVLSQNAKIRIDENKTVTVDEVFDLIMSQTDYSFIYQVDMFKNMTKISLKKGVIKVNDLLNKSLSSGSFILNFVDNNIIIQEKKTNQQVPVKGKVTDSNGLPLPGVNIIEKDKNNGTITNINGEYTIATSSSDAVLVFSFVGYSTQEVVVNNQTEINVILKESVYELSTINLISTGYQEISREKLTGAAEAIDKSFYENAYRPTLQEGLQGSVAGLQILNNNSHPQAVPQVIIRGVGSAFGEGVGVVGFSGQPSTVLGNPPILTPGSPLYIVDGVPTFDGRDLSNINGNDIKSITVLKDAAATSIYGARAANGVIVVETKSGKSGKARVTYSTQIGVSDFTVLNKPLNSSQLQELYIEGLINNTTNGIVDEAGALNFLSNPTGNLKPFNVNQNTDWADELTRTGVMKQHNISASGGNEANNYYLSIGYLENEAPLREINFDRLNVRLKYNTKISERLNVMANLGFGNAKSNNHETGASFYNPYRSIYQVRPDFRIFNDDGSYDTSYNFAVNPLGILTDEKRQLQTNDFRGVLDLNYKIMDGLTFETNLSANYSLNENYNRFPSYLGIGFNRGRDNYGNQLNTNNFIWNARALLRYDMQFGDGNNLNIFVGTESNAVNTKTINSSVRGLRVGAETLDNGITENTFTTKVETALTSWFSNAVYDYKGKYLASASFRRDGSSRFGGSNKYGNFYAFGLGWNIHKESFMSNVEAVNMLKLRTSYGVNGNDQIGLFGYSGTFNTTGFYNDNNAATIASAGNASIGWEENASFDIGIDFSVFNNRISGSIDYYNRQTSRLLYNLPVSSLNADTFVFQNFGGMQNSGVEIALNTQNIVSVNNGFSWNSAITFTSNRNEITELRDDEIISGNSIRQVGQDFNTLYIFGYAGVDPETGVETFYTDETETTTTTNIAEASKYNHGRTTPDFYASLINTISFKNFSLTAQIYTSWGGQVFETLGRAQNDNGSMGLRDDSNTSRYVYDNRWQNPGDITDVPKYVYLNARSNNQTSRWLYDSSFIRLRRLELAYNFSNQMLENTFIRSLRLNISGDNLWTYVKDDRITNDPEIGGITGSASFDTPLIKTIYFGLNVSF